MSGGVNGKRLSAAIVCKNNERSIGRTIESLKGLCDEIVAVDSGSTDRTIEMLEAAGAKVIRSAWLGHIKTKQMALEACGGAWVLCIDSDESVQPDLAASIKHAIDQAGDDRGVGGFMVNRKVYYQGVALNYAWQPEWRCRVVRHGAARWGGIDPHDVLSVQPGCGGTRKLAGTLRHDSFETFLEQLGKQVRYARIQAEGMMREGYRTNPLTPMRLLVSPPAAFLKQLVLKRAMLDGRAGWMAAACAGAQALMKQVALMELSERNPKT
jgi:glycosyltransferase involved in cell wall biosynthesis